MQRTKRAERLAVYGGRERATRLHLAQARFSAVADMWPKTSGFRRHGAELPYNCGSPNSSLRRFWKSLDLGLTRFGLKREQSASLYAWAR